MTEKSISPVLAATVILMRDTGDKMEVFLGTRSKKVDFASGVLVFPGGKVDKDDYDSRLTNLLCIAGNEQENVLHVAAIREVYEECGVLLARVEDGALVDVDCLSKMNGKANLLNQGEIGFVDFIEQSQLILANDLLALYAHWITPEVMPKRFDTYFFLACLPADQKAVHDGQELVNSLWVSPSEAIDGNKNGKYSIIFPTKCNLDKLAKNINSAEAMRRAKSESDSVIAITPRLEKRQDGNSYLCIPKESGYTLIEELLPKRPSR